VRVSDTAKFPPRLHRQGQPSSRVSPAIQGAAVEEANRPGSSHAGSTGPPHDRASRCWKSADGPTPENNQKPVQPRTMIRPPMPRAKKKKRGPRRIKRLAARAQGAGVPDPPKP